MKPIVPALALAAVLALPATAAAHPSVYKDTAQTVPDESQPTVLEPQTRYVVANHGFTYVLRETNLRDTGGMLDYKSLPGPYRATLTWNELVAAGTRGVQPHATCEVAALTSEQAIRSWQDEDPFYAYIPFQTASAGLDDDPATWIPEVKARTGVDLATVADPAAACAGLGGTYVPADETQSSNAQFNSGLIEHEVEPLKTALADAEKAKLDLQGLLGAARAEVARLAAQLAPDDRGAAERDGEVRGAAQAGHDRERDRTRRLGGRGRSHRRLRHGAQARPALRPARPRDGDARRGRDGRGDGEAGQEGAQGAAQGRARGGVLRRGALG